MANKFVVVEQPVNYSGESFYDNLAKSYLDYIEINQAFKQLDRGFEAYEVFNNLREVVKKNEVLTPSLESSLNNTITFYKDVLGDHTTSISLESYSDSKRKRTVAIEGIGDWLKRIWQSIINFFKRIWNWITGKKESSSGSSNKDKVKEVKDKKEETEKAVKKIEESNKKFDELKKELEKAKTTEEKNNLINSHENKKTIAQEFKDELNKSFLKFNQELQEAELKRIKEEELAKKRKDIENKKEAFKGEVEVDARKFMQNKIDSFYEKNKPTVDKFYYRIGFYEPSMFFPVMVQILNSLLKNIEVITKEFNEFFEFADQTLSESIINSVEDLKKVPSLIKEKIRNLNLGISIDSMNAKINGGLQHNKEDFEKAEKQYIFLFDNKVLVTTFLSKFKNNNIKNPNLSAPIEIKTNHSVPVKKEDKRNIDDHYDVEIKDFDDLLKVEEIIDSKKEEWSKLSEKATKLFEKISNKAAENKDDDKELKEFLDSKKEEVLAKSDFKITEEENQKVDDIIIDFYNTVVLVSKVMMEKSKNVISAITVTTFIINNSVDILNLIDKNKQYRTLLEALRLDNDTKSQLLYIDK